VRIGFGRFTTEDEVDRVRMGLEDGSLHPNAVKRRLGREIVTLYHDDAAARLAEDHFDTIHKRGEVPDDIPLHRLDGSDPVSLAALIRAAGLASSGGEARRLIQQGAVRIDGSVVGEFEVARSTLVGTVLQVGKRRFARLEG